MMDFRTRDIVNFEQLKRELEKEYLSKRSTAHLQLEFNSLKQKPNESAQEFGRIDNIAMEFYPWKKAKTIQSSSNARS
ncbi:hypothetical protein P5V15_004384 [Pogonomyrmex californicus]